MGHCGVGLSNKMHYLNPTCSGFLSKWWWAHIQSYCVYNVNSFTFFSEIWYKIQNEMLGWTMLTTWLMISLHRFNWLFVINWNDGFYLTRMLDATLWILPWSTVGELRSGVKGFATTNATGSHRLLVQAYAEKLPHKNKYSNLANKRGRIYKFSISMNLLVTGIKRFLSIMGQNANLIKARGLFHRKWPCFW